MRKLMVLALLLVSVSVYAVTAATFNGKWKIQVIAENEIVGNGTGTIKGNSFIYIEDKEVTYFNIYPTHDFSEVDLAIRFMNYSKYDVEIKSVDEFYLHPQFESGVSYRFVRIKK